MLPARPRSRPTDDGSALVAVLGTMAVLVLFLLVTLTYAVQNLAPAREDQDAKAALAAAQAGVDDYLSRLNADNNYWQTTDPANTAYTTGLPLPGTGGTPPSGTPSCAGCSFTYQRLGTVEEVAQTGSLRLRVTGRAGATTRTVVASLQPVGFLKYVYYTDVEAVDPVLYSSYAPVTVDGQSSSVNGNTTDTYIANPAWVEQVCAKRYWEGRVKPLSYTSTSSNLYYHYTTRSGSYVGTTQGGLGKNVVLTGGCRDLQWITGDVVDGPLHTNDALYITQAPLFKNSFSKAPAVETSWLDGSPVPPPAGGRWWGGGTPDPAGQQPVAQPLVELPDSNTSLKTAAQSSGCVYTGATKITFTDTTMTVHSPNSATVNRSSCLNTATRSSPQTVPIPPAVYVQAGTGTACVGYPLVLPAAGGTPARTEAALGAVPDHTCSRGTAYVSGRLQGAATVGTDSDVVITGDLTYRSGTNGSDVLGLVANNNVWIYHPVSNNGSTTCTPQPACRGDNMLTAAQEVHHVQAAVLSLRHSFLVQSWDYGAPLDAGTGQKLNVTGSISQKFRGPVGTAGGTGYKKGYAYDKRLLAIPPPFFLQPKTTPWFVKEMSG